MPISICIVFVSFAFCYNVTSKLHHYFSTHHIDINIHYIKLSQPKMPRQKVTPKQNHAGVHVWLILMKAFQAIMPHAQESIARTGLGDSDFRVLEALLHKGPLPVNTIGPKVWLTPGPSVPPLIAWFEKD